MRVPWLLSVTAAASAFASPISAEPAPPVLQPAFHVGDSWVFQDVTESGPHGYREQRLDMTIDRVGDGVMTIGLKPDGAVMPPEDHIVGIDWSQRRLVDGKETMTTRPFIFPMTIGKKWTVDFVDPIRRGNQLSDHVSRTYTVIGWEDVTVPAGRFHALKVEADGVDQATIDVPNKAVGGVAVSREGSTAITHAEHGGISQLTRTRHEELYYVPAIKNYVKSVGEQYDMDNVRVSRETRSLVSFTPAP